MGKSQETYKKKEVRNKKEKKRKEKEKKKLLRKENEKNGPDTNMIAYVDENGNITSEPPDPNKKRIINAENIEISVARREDQVVNNTGREGKVTFFNESKGYGFIRDFKTQESIFVHMSNLIDNIALNDSVIYNIVIEQKGPTATEVKLAPKK